MSGTMPGAVYFSVLTLIGGLSYSVWDTSSRSGPMSGSLPDPVPGPVPGTVSCLIPTVFGSISSSD